MKTPTRTIKIIVLSIVVCSGMYQIPINAGVFTHDPTAGDYVQLTTALASLPASIAAQEYPDKKIYVLAEHFLKAINEGTALVNQHGYITIPWFIYDLAKSLHTIIQLAKNAQPEPLEPDADTHDHDIELDSILGIKPTTQLSNPIKNDLNVVAGTAQPEASHVKRYTRILLTGIEGTIRIITALRNGKGQSWQEKDYLFYSRELLNSIGSLSRLANNYLTATDQKHKALVIILLIANIVESVCVNKHYKSVSKDFEDYSSNQVILDFSNNKDESEEPLNINNNTLQQMQKLSAEEKKRVNSRVTQYLNKYKTLISSLYSDQKNSGCSICCSSKFGGKFQIVTLPCQHRFHYACIASSMSCNQNCTTSPNKECPHQKCPLCREKIDY